MNERIEEADARELVQSVLCIKLSFHDTNGSVDYLFSDGAERTGALEVTTYTNAGKQAAVLAWSRLQPFRATSLGKSWSVSTMGDPQYTGLPSRLQPQLEELERRGLQEVQVYDLALRAYTELDLAPLAAALQAEKVSTATSFAAGREGPRIVIRRGGGGANNGSNAAVAEICGYIKITEDNLRKLQSGNWSDRHLFVWVTNETNETAAWQLQDPRLAREAEAFGLPTESPSLPLQVTHLWVVHRTSGRGWYWNAHVWQAVRGRPL